MAQKDEAKYKLIAWLKVTLTLSWWKVKPGKRKGTKAAELLDRKHSNHKTEGAFSKLNELASF